MKERTVAVKEFKEAQSMGEVVAMTTISRNEHSIMTTKIGNLPSEETVTIEY